MKLDGLGTSCEQKWTEVNATPQDFVQLQLSSVTPMQILLLKYIRCSFLIKILDSRMNFHLNCSRTLLKSEKSAGGEKEERGAGRRRRPGCFSCCTKFIADRCTSVWCTCILSAAPAYPQNIISCTCILSTYPMLHLHTLCYTCIPSTYHLLHLHTLWAAPAYSLNCTCILSKKHMTHLNTLCCTYIP